MNWQDISIVEGVVIIFGLAVLVWTIHASRKTRRFRAGIFVERDDEDGDS